MTGRRRDYLASHTLEASGCWNYTGTFNKGNGYGRILQTTSHRYYYEALVGEIPAGLQIDHLCRNIRCVNPDHLEPVTNAENARRRSAVLTHCKYGHEFTPETTYVRSNRAGRECVTCRSARGVATIGEFMKSQEVVVAS